MHLDKMLAHCQERSALLAFDIHSILHLDTGHSFDTISGQNVSELPASAAEVLPDGSRCAIIHVTREGSISGEIVGCACVGCRWVRFFTDIFTTDNTATNPLVWQIKTCS